MYKYFYIYIFVQVTEQVRSSIEARMKEAENQYRRLEGKLLEAEKEKQDLEEQQSRAQTSLEEQVLTIAVYNLISRYILTLKFKRLLHKPLALIYPLGSVFSFIDILKIE